MKSLKLMLCLCAFILLAGCVSLFDKAPIGEGIESLRDNPRILFRDLTKPYHPSNQDPHQYGVVVSRYRLNLDHGFITQIEFANERVTPLDKSVFVKLVKSCLEDEGARVVLVGHSHGKSQKGNATLAVDRTETMAHLLMNAGISKERITQAATWSAYVSSGFSKSVRVYIVPNNLRWITFKRA